MQREATQYVKNGACGVEGGGACGCHGVGVGVQGVGVQGAGSRAQGTGVRVGTGGWGAQVGTFSSPTGGAPITTFTLVTAPRPNMGQSFLTQRSRDVMVKALAQNDPHTATFFCSLFSGRGRCAK